GLDALGHRPRLDACTVCGRAYPFRHAALGAGGLVCEACARSETGLVLISGAAVTRSEEHTSELQSLAYLVCRLLLEKKKTSKGLPNGAHQRYPAACSATTPAPAAVLSIAASRRTQGTPGGALSERFAQQRRSSRTKP